MIQVPTGELEIARYELTDAEWKIIAPLLPNKTRGVPRVDDRRVLNGIFWRLRSGAPWADIPERYGPYTTCYNRFVRWRAAGVCDRILKSVSQAYNGKIQMIDRSVIPPQANEFDESRLLSSVISPVKF